MNLTRRELDIGLGHTAVFLHRSDDHLTYADGRDDTRKNRLAQERSGVFGFGSACNEAPLNECLAYARAKGETLLYTGDLLDFVSVANLEAGRRILAGIPHIFCVGNHEFSLYVGEAKEDDAYKAQSAAAVLAMMGEKDFTYSETVLHGIRFIALDNSYYTFTAAQGEKLREAAKHPEPIVLLLHTPLYTDGGRAQFSARHPGEPLYCAGAPEEMLATYTPDRREQQTPDRVTRELIDRINRTPQIRCILAGHSHETMATVTAGGIPQFIIGGGFAGEAEEIVFR